MAKGDAFWRNEQRKYDLKTAETEGRVADSMEIRLALIAKMHAGEMTLDEVQTELARIKRGAKAAGKVTRAQAFRGR
jgi:hypothetical protein